MHHTVQYYLPICIFLTTITFLIQVSQYSQYFSRKKEHENDERSRKEEALRRQRSSVCISLLDNAPNYLPVGCIIQKRSFHYFKALLSFSKRKIMLKIFLNLANSCFKIQPILQSKKRN